MLLPEPDDEDTVGLPVVPIRTPWGVAPEVAPDESLSVADVVGLLAEELSRTLLLIADLSRRVTELERRPNDEGR